MQIYSTGLFTQGTAEGKPSSEVAILCQEHMKMDCFSKNVYKFVKVETSWNLLPVLKIVGRTCSAASRQKSLLLSVWLGVLFLVRFNNFDRTTGFYWNYTLLLKPPILMRSCCVHLVLCELFYTSCKFCANNYLHKRSPLYSTVHPIKFLESDVMWDKYRYICYNVITNVILNIGMYTSPYSFLHRNAVHSVLNSTFISAYVHNVMYWLFW